MKRTTLSISFASVMALLCPSGTPACSLIPDGLGIAERKAKPSNDVALHGTLVKADTVLIENDCGNDIPVSGLKLYFRVKKAFGSAAGVGDTMAIGTTLSTCGVTYPLGAEVIVFAENNKGDCWAPGGMLVTYLWSYNVHQPTQAQLDTLYGVTASIAADGTGNRRAQISGGKASSGTATA